MKNVRQGDGETSPNASRDRCDTFVMKNVRQGDGETPPNASRDGCDTFAMKNVRQGDRGGWLEEECFLPISGLQKLLFCERQCALMYLEQIFLQNLLTVEGDQLHARADLAGEARRSGVRVARALRLVCRELGVVGIADVVEFYPGVGGKEQPFPVEYKRGGRRARSHDAVQVCAQAMALEEMLEVEVPRGALYYGQKKRRLEVEFDEELRDRTRAAARRFHGLMEGGVVPLAERQPKCDGCSLLPICLPEVVGARRSARVYLAGLTKEPSMESNP